MAIPVPVLVPHVNPLNFVTHCPILPPSPLGTCLYEVLTMLPWRCPKDSGRDRPLSLGAYTDLHFLQPYFWGEQGGFIVFLERALSCPSIHPSTKSHSTLISSPLNYSNSPLRFPLWAPRIFNWLHRTPPPAVRQFPACLSSSDPANTFQILFLFQKPEIMILAPGVLEDFPDERSDSQLRSWGGGRK